MERRFELRKRQILKDAELKPELSKGMLDRLETFAGPFAASLSRCEMKEHARRYLGGLLSDLKRKNIESIAYRSNQDRRGLQHFIGASAWDFMPLERTLVCQVGNSLGQPDGVIVFDPSGHKKCGKDSVGVHRQWLGRLGKIENCQVGLYMGYVSRCDHALVASRLYLPKEWAKDRNRRKRCGVPKEIRFQTRHELALGMLKAHGHLLPHKWIAGDDEMGRSSAFRRHLRELEELYLLGVPSNTSIRDFEAPLPPYAGRGPHPQQPFQRVDRWCVSLSESDWAQIDVRDSEKGPLVLEIVKRRVLARTERSRDHMEEELLVVTRYKDSGGTLKYDYYLSNASADTPVDELARVTKAEHLIENAIKRAKSQAGLSDYQTRTWSGWHHHNVLSLIATWFLACEMRRGKKIHSRRNGSSDSYAFDIPIASSLRLRTSRLEEPICTAKKPPKGTCSLLLLQET